MFASVLRNFLQAPGPGCGVRGDGMAHRVCPWWMGPLLLNPLRRWAVQPERLLAPYVREGMVVLEPGPGMGFMTLPLARLVGPHGKVIAVDIQPKMVEKLKERAARDGFSDRIETRIATRDSLQVIDLAGSVDFALAFAMVHEVPSVERFFLEIATVLKPGAALLLVEPSGHVRAEDFDAEIHASQAAGLVVVQTPKISRNHATVLRKPVSSW
jgi:ubiquinone/menaquinone biosynthesis C-methylase UbiE